jgi:hypothetical protein
MAFIVPPGGFKGFAQMTPASQRALGGGAAPRRRKRSRTAGAKSPGEAAYMRNRPRKRKKGKRARKASGKKRGGMKFGSPAWQKKYKVGKYRA